MTRRKPASRSPTDTDKQVGLRVRELRTGNNMTLAELGAALGISHQQLQKYETGTNRLSAGMLAGVAGVLGVGVSDLFDDGKAGRDKKATPLDKARDECHRLVDRAGSVAKLKDMARVLKALAND